MTTGVAIERANGHSNGRVKLEGDGVLTVTVVRVERVVPSGYAPQKEALELVVSGEYMPGLAEILQRPTSENYGLVSQRNALAEVIRKLTVLDEAIMNNRPTDLRENQLFDGGKVARTEFRR